MNTSTAREVLGVSQSASFSEIRSSFRKLARRYHPDLRNEPNANSNQFILISTAYLVLQGKQLGLEIDNEVADDISMAINLKAEIDNYFDETTQEFLDTIRLLKRRTEQYLRERIYSAGSTDELKRILEGQVAYCLADLSAEISRLLQSIELRINSSDDDFLFGLFRDMYAARRKYWLLDLYRNPVTIFEAVCQAIFFLVRHYPELRTAFPIVWPLLSIWWLPVSFLMGGLVVLLVQFLLLNPRRQFVPPRLSIRGLHTLVRSISRNIQPTPLQIGAGASILLAAIGTLLFPGLGTLVGAVAGSLFGFAGTSLAESKERAYNDIRADLDMGLRQISDRVLVWAEQSKADLRRAAVESFARNCRRIAGLLSKRALSVRRITDKGRLLKK